MGIIQTTKTLRPREKNDFYPTPVELVRESLNLLDTKYPYSGAYFVLDPGAGDGVWGEGMRAKYPTAYIIGSDIRDIPKPSAYDLWFTEDDYLDTHIRIEGYDYIVGNPPYRYAEEFVRKSYNMLVPSGQLLFLLRLAFLEGQKRSSGLWAELKPKKVYVLNRRPSFTGNHKTDATAYMLCLWEKGYSGDTMLDWLKWDYDKSQ